ncbi:MAG: tRNA lysidine(34) synthetase TilS [Thermomicrobiales bacterium]
MNAGDAWIRGRPAYRAVVHGWPDRPLLACSGGVDSSALLLLAGSALRRGDITPFVVVHVNHQTRPDSAIEADAVEDLASSFGVQTVRVGIQAGDAPDATASPEERLRILRYASLARVAGDLGVGAVVTAHTLNDQVETILMRLLGGAGGLAAAGMARRQRMETIAGTIELHRPLLDISRDELLEVLGWAGVTPLTDPTNAHRAYRRNALRHDVVPVLRTVFPGFEPALVRSVTLAARDAAALDEIASQAASANATQRGDATRVNRASLRSADPAVSTRVIRWAASRLMPDNQRELSFERIESVRNAVSGRTGAMIELPYGVVARVTRDEVVFERRNGQRDSECQPEAT